MGRWVSGAGGKLLAIAFGVLVLAAVEGGLRLWWEGGSDPAQVWTRIDPFQVRAGEARTREAFLGALRPSRFPVPKPAGTFRVFCLGGSTTFGYPFPAAVAWPALLEERLRFLYPGRKVEVINAGGTSYGSARALGVLRAVVGYQPDLVVFCGGDAEFVEDSYRAAVATPRSAAGRLRSLRLARLLGRWLPRVRTAGVVDVDETGTTGFFFSPVIDGTVYRPTRERRDAVLAGFAANLSAMADLAAAKGVGFVLCTLPSNVADWPPDEDGAIPKEPGLEARWGRAVGRAGRLEESGDPAGAAAAYQEAVGLWDGNAAVSFRLGRALAALGRWHEALPHLARARDLDPSPVRATAAANALVRGLSARRGLALADLEAAFSAASPYGAVGDRLILDYAHPTPEGHLLAARTVWDAMCRSGAPWARFDAGREAELRSREDAAAQEEPILDGNLAFVWGQIYLRKGRPERAAALFRRAIETGYDLPYAPLNLAAALAAQGALSQAQSVLLALVSQHPQFAETYPLLGSVAYQLGERAEAIRAYREATARGNTDRGVILALGELLVEAGQGTEARAVLEQGTRLYPEDCELMATRGRTLELEGNWQGAEDVYRDLIADDPACHLARENLGVMLMNRGAWAAAERVFRDALGAAGGGVPLDHLNLGYVYAVGLGQEEAALEQFRVYQQLEPQGVERIPEVFRSRLDGAEPPREAP
jgi:tetratricopeptide (TPR) repeat protein